MRRTAPLLVQFLVFFLPRGPTAADWPQFRGPDGQGHAAAEGLPVTWNEKKNIAWKVAVPGKGWSSPVLLGKRLWLTAALRNGRSLRALSLDRESGKVLLDVEVFDNRNPGLIHAKNSHASPTPLLEDDRVYVHYGAFGTACLSADGRILWKTRLKYQHAHGPGGSPVLFEDVLIISCDGTDVQFVVALDKRTGNVRWRQTRRGRMAFSTPLVIEVAGAAQVVSTGGDAVVAYNPLNGDEIWSCSYNGYSLVPRPVYGHGLVFICTGYNTPSLYAVRPDGKGDVTRTHVAWRLGRGVPHNPSPLLIGDELYLVSDRGIALCLDARTGKRHWQKRLGGDCSASPVYADGKIYYLDERAVTTVVEPGKKFRALAVNRLQGRAQASIAVSGKALYLRTERHLYRIEEGAKPAPARKRKTRRKASGP